MTYIKLGNMGVAGIILILGVVVLIAIPIYIQIFNWMKVRKREREIKRLENKMQREEGRRGILLNDDGILVDIAKNCEDTHARRAAVEKLTDKNVLASVAKNHNYGDVRAAAVEKIADQQILLDIANNDKDPEVRRAAAKKYFELNPIREGAYHGADQSAHADFAGDDSLRWKARVEEIEGLNTQFSLFAPSSLARGDSMMVQVYLHNKKAFEKITAKALMRDESALLRAMEDLSLPLKYGDKVEIRLVMPRGVEVDEPVQQIVWRDEMKAIDFVVTVPPSHQLGNMIGTVIVCKDSLPVCSVKFITKIGVQAEENAPQARTYPVYYKKVFVSYSSADREEVLKIATGFKALHVDFFLDKLYLDGGDKYQDEIFKYINQADLFLLCWSLNASRSEWVKKEYSYALERINRPDMGLSIYPVIIEPKAEPPEELNEYHFVEVGYMPGQRKTASGGEIGLVGI